MQVLVMAARQRQIADRDDMLARPVRFKRMPSAITESVELFDIAELEMRLLLNPGTQTDFECAMLSRIERTERKRIPAA